MRLCVCDWPSQRFARRRRVVLQQKLSLVLLDDGRRTAETKATCSRHGSNALDEDEDVRKRCVYQNHFVLDGYSEKVKTATSTKSLFIRVLVFVPVCCCSTQPEVMKSGSISL